MTQQQGFTLLEVLVALTLFAVVGGALLSMFHGGLANVSASASYTHAALLAQSKLEELQSYQRLRPGTEEGESADGFRWRTVLQEADLGGKDGIVPLTPLHLALEVSWGEPDAPESVRVESLLLSRWNGE